MSRPPRPSFSPSPYLEDPCAPLLAEKCDFVWTPVCSCPADFPIELFDAAVSQLVHHPEFNSTLILRSEVLAETDKEAEHPHETPRLLGFRVLKTIRRKLLARRPGRDPPIEQYCAFYAVERPDGGSEHEDNPSSCLVLTPILNPGQQMPFYHPSVHHLAFRYLKPPQALESDTNVPESSYEAARLRIEIVARSDAPDPKDVNSRLYRTCLALLETVHRYGWGALTNYQKRVHHDCLVTREEYQDLYLIMRERHKHLVDTWQEATDPLKHVFEDIGIATFLMLLWKQNRFNDYSPNSAGNRESSKDDVPWRYWPRPPGGFLDFGCGNGLLVHILISEGYVGEGIDVRARTSWGHYPPSTQAHLHVHAFNPLDILTADGQSGPAIDATQPFVKHGTFIIANHADELTPWTPVLATLCGASGYLSIPCCPWSFDAKFERSMFSLRGQGPFNLTLSDNMTEEDFVNSLMLGGDGSSASSYSKYRIWLSKLSLHCGWVVECETLRIPSTRNWAIIGRQLEGGGGDLVMKSAAAIVNQVRERGIFKSRRPEGSAREH